MPYSPPQPSNSLVDRYRRATPATALTVQEAAGLLGVSPDHVRRRLRQRRLVQARISIRAAHRTA
jgi:hypothetical protein